MVGVRFLNATTEALSTRYFHADQLGSISAITDENGNVVQYLSYDPWGKRRFANGTDDPTDSITSVTTRGFTAQEELGVSGLVHLNGCIYDPLVARMLSADPTVPDPLNPQAWNRYSYVGNDPLTFTDPTGFSWLSHFFHEVASYLQANPLVRSVLQIGLTTLLSLANPGLGFVGAFIAATASAAIVTGLAGGKLSDDIRAAAIAGATAVAFFVVGLFTGDTPAFGTLQYAENIAGHAAVGCMSAVISGGACGPGAVAGAAGSAVAPIAGQAGLYGGTAISGVAGGLASVAVGGKFENGAVTAAFGYLFNSAAGALRGWGIGSGIGAWGAGLLGLETGPADAGIILTGRWIGGALGAMLGDWITWPDIVFNQPSVPQRAIDVADTIAQTGDTFPGYKGGDPFNNDGRGGGQILPEQTAQGGSITYQEWDVNPYTQGVNRGPERLVTGSDGSRWFTGDHYKTFIPF
jgi:RHS repeat-associated protein